jgi:hypothetical protein
MISEPIARLAQTMHLSCIEINTISKQTKMSPSGAAKKISMLVVYLAQLCSYLAPRLTLSANEQK